MNESNVFLLRVWKADHMAIARAQSQGSKGLNYLLIPKVPALQLYFLWANAFAKHVRPIWHYASAIFYSTFKSIKFVTHGWMFPCYKNFQCSTLCSLPFDPTTSKSIPCIFPHYTCICEQDPSGPLMCSLYSLLTSQSIPPLWYWDSHILFLLLPGEEVAVKAKDKHCLMTLLQDCKSREVNIF